jgi:hypothetical protein
MPTAFVQLRGDGALPPLTKAVSYRLCVDYSTKQLTSVRSADEGEASSDDPVTSALRHWSWSVDANTPIEAVVCWREQFIPIVVGGKPSIRAKHIAPLQYLRLGEWHDELTDTPTDSDSIPIVDIIEDGYRRQAIETPSLWVKQPTPEPTQQPKGPLKYLDNQKVAGDLPHLPPWVKFRYRSAELSAIYKVCINTEGNVTEVIPIVHLPSGNAQVINTVMMWKYKPQPIPLCFINRYVFGIH